MSKFKPILSSIIMGKMRSLANKVDKLGVLTRIKLENLELSTYLFVSLRYGCRTTHPTSLSLHTDFSLYRLKETGDRAVRTKKKELQCLFTTNAAGHVTVQRAAAQNQDKGLSQDMSVILAEFSLKSAAQTVEDLFYAASLFETRIY